MGRYKSSNLNRPSRGSRVTWSRSSEASYFNDPVSGFITVLSLLVGLGGFVSVGYGAHLASAGVGFSDGPPPVGVGEVFGDGGAVGKAFPACELDVCPDNFNSSVAFVLVGNDSSLARAGSGFADGLPPAAVGDVEVFESFAVLTGRYDYFGTDYSTSSSGSDRGRLGDGAKDAAHSGSGANDIFGIGAGFAAAFGGGLPTYAAAVGVLWALVVVATIAILWFTDHWRRRTSDYDEKTGRRRGRGRGRERRRAKEARPKPGSKRTEFPASTTPRSLYADDLAALHRSLLGVLAYVLYAFCSLPWCRLGQHLAGHVLADVSGSLLMLGSVLLVVLVLRGRLLLKCFILGSCTAVGLHPTLGLTSMPWWITWSAVSVLGVTLQRSLPPSWGHGGDVWLNQPVLGAAVAQLAGYAATEGLGLLLSLVSFASDDGPVYAHYASAELAHAGTAVFGEWSTAVFPWPTTAVAALRVGSALLGKGAHLSSQRF
jgi:hypothetical protein